MEGLKREEKIAEKERQRRAKLVAAEAEKARKEMDKSRR